LQLELEERVSSAKKDLKRELTGEADTETTTQVFVSMKYPGQSHELLIAAAALDLAELSARFDENHKRRFGHYDPLSPVEIATIRIRLSSPSHRTIQAFTPSGSSSTSEHGSVWTGGGWMEGRICSRSELGIGAELYGPAVVHQMDATTLILSGWRGHVANDGTLVIELHDQR
jgi:N-methylhydantoinase A